MSYYDAIGMKDEISMNEVMVKNCGAVQPVYINLGAKMCLFFANVHEVLGKHSSNSEVGAEGRLYV